MSAANEHPQLTSAREFAHGLRELSRSSPRNVALSIQAEGEPAVNLLANNRLRLRSVYKMVIGLAYAKKVAEDPSFATKTVPIANVDSVAPSYYDGGAHANWKAALPAAAEEVTHEAIAKGMLQESSNACTQYMLDTIGRDNVNALIAERGLEMDPFFREYDELHRPLKGSPAATIKVMQRITTEETPQVRAAFEAVTSPMHVRSVNGEEARGFIKGGSGAIQRPGANDLMHDLNFSWHVAGEKPVSGSLMLNNMSAAETHFFDSRFDHFVCEASCNPSFRQECTSIFEGLSKVASQAMRFVERTHMHPL